MTIEVAGRSRTVEATRAGGGWLVRVDGRTWTASVAASGGRWSLLYGPAGTRVFASREVVVERADGADGVVRVDGRVVPVSWTARRAAMRDREAPGPAAGAGSEVRAPMPGRIVRVLVEVGQTVQVNQGLVVVEAMKMENELRASVSGVVREVRVRPGTLVEARTLLLVLEP